MALNGGDVPTSRTSNLGVWKATFEIELRAYPTPDRKATRLVVLHALGNGDEGASIVAYKSVEA
jgi:hypothetical protein